MPTGPKKSKHFKPEVGMVVKSLQSKKRFTILKVDGNFFQYEVKVRMWAHPSAGYVVKSKKKRKRLV